MPGDAAVERERVDEVTGLLREAAKSVVWLANDLRADRDSAVQDAARRVEECAELCCRVEDLEGTVEVLSGELGRVRGELTGAQSERDTWRARALAAGCGCGGGNA